MTHIYLDDEAKERLKKIRKQTPEFNLSNFVKFSIIDYVGDSEDIEALYKKISEYKIKIDSLTNEVILLERKIEKIHGEERLKLLDKEEEIKLKYRKDEMQSYWDSMTEEENKYYQEGIKNKLWKNSVDYFDNFVKRNNGYKENQQSIYTEKQIKNEKENNKDGKL